MVPIEEFECSPLSRRERHVRTPAEARDEIARLDADDAERRALALFKRCQQLDGQSAARQSKEAGDAAKGRAQYEEAVADLAARCGPGMAERISPFAAYDLLVALPSGRVIAFPDGEALKRRGDVQRILGEAVQWHRPPHCRGRDMPDHVTSALAVGPSDAELREMAGRVAA